MSYRLPGERVTLELEGPSVEVQRVIAWPIFWTALRLDAAFEEATTPDAEAVALRDLYAYFLAEAQPTFEILDHRGVVAPTIEGLLRLPVELGRSMIAAWLESHLPKPTAADAVLPPGPVRDEINARLKAKKSDPEV